MSGNYIEEEDRRAVYNVSTFRSVADTVEIVSSQLNRITLQSHVKSIHNRCITFYPIRCAVTVLTQSNSRQAISKKPTHGKHTQTFRLIM